MEINHTVSQRIKRIIFSYTYILSGIVFSSTLTNNNITSDHFLSTPNFNA